MYRTNPDEALFPLFLKLFHSLRQIVSAGFEPLSQLFENRQMSSYIAQLPTTQARHLRTPHCQPESERDSREVHESKVVAVQHARSTRDRASATVASSHVPKKPRLHRISERVTITATTQDQSLTAKSTIHVVPIALEAIAITPATTLVPVGSTFPLNAKVTPKNASDRSVNWTSSNKTVAAVDAKGRVTALTEGTATIRAVSSEGGFESQSVISVVRPKGSPVYGPRRKNCPTAS